MSKTYVYLIVLIGVYLIIVKGFKMTAETPEKETHVSVSGVIHGGGGSRRNDTKETHVSTSGVTHSGGGQRR